MCLWWLYCEIGNVDDVVFFVECVEYFGGFFGEVDDVLWVGVGYEVIFGVGIVYVNCVFSCC